MILRMPSVILMLIKMILNMQGEVLLSFSQGGWVVNLGCVRLSGYRGWVCVWLSFHNYSNFGLN